LKRIEGQVRGIEKMIENDRDCESVITQLGAVHSAVEGVGALLLRNYKDDGGYDPRYSRSKDSGVSGGAVRHLVWQALGEGCQGHYPVSSM